MKTEAVKLYVQKNLGHEVTVRLDCPEHGIAPFVWWPERKVHVCKACVSEFCLSLDTKLKAVQVVH